jgi:hypothetical protein
VAERGQSRRVLARRLALVACGVALLAPASVGAQQDDVVVDPDSPTGKEYRIPLEGARRDADPSADGKAAGPRGATEPAPLFGEGIVATAKGSKSTGRNGSKTGSAETGVEDTPRRGAGPAPATSTTGAPAGGTSTLLLIGGGGALVLLIGVLAGVALRGRTGG